MEKSPDEPRQTPAHLPDESEGGGELVPFHIGKTRMPPPDRVLAAVVRQETSFGTQQVSSTKLHSCSVRKLLARIDAEAPTRLSHRRPSSSDVTAARIGQPLRPADAAPVERAPILPRSAAATASEPGPTPRPPA